MCSTWSIQFEWLFFFLLLYGFAIGVIAAFVAGFSEGTLVGEIQKYLTWRPNNKCQFMNSYIYCWVLYSLIYIIFMSCLHSFFFRSMANDGFKKKLKLKLSQSDLIIGSCAKSDRRKKRKKTTQICYFFWLLNKYLVFTVFRLLTSDIHELDAFSHDHFIVFYMHLGILELLIIFVYCTCSLLHASTDSCESRFYCMCRNSFALSICSNKINKQKKKDIP